MAVAVNNQVYSIIMGVIKTGQLGERCIYSLHQNSSYVKSQKPCYKVWYLTPDVYIITVVVVNVVIVKKKGKWLSPLVQLWAWMRVNSHHSPRGQGSLRLGIAEVPLQLSSLKLRFRTIISDFGRPNLLKETARSPKYLCITDSTVCPIEWSSRRY